MSLKSASNASAAATDLESRIAELEAALAREARVSSALREVGLALGTTLDLDQLLELILAKITEALDADRATLYLLDEANAELVSRVLQGSEVQSIRLRVGHGIAGHVAKTGKALVVKDAYKDPRFNPEWDSLSGYRTRSILAAPMKNHLGRPIGVVQVLNKKSGEFTDVDGQVLAVLATQAAIAIDNSRLFLSVTQKNIQLLDTKEQLEHRVRDLKLLFGLESAMGRASSLEELFQAVLGEALRVLQPRAAAALLRDPATASYTLFVLDERTGRLRQQLLRDPPGLIGYAMRTGEVVVSSNAAVDPRNAPELDDLLGFSCATCIAVPVEGDNEESMGAIALYDRRDGRPFEDEDRSLLVLIGANASTAIRLQLAREQREREARLTTIGRLLSGIIHDMKTPLTVISGYVQLMQQTESKPLRDQYAELILKQFDHIGTMQREVLEFARGQRSLLVRRVYLAKFFEDVRGQLEKQLAQQGVELVVDVQDRGTARFDEGKILRVIHNLARNATEAMGERGGQFTIRVSREAAATTETTLAVREGKAAEARSGRGSVAPGARRSAPPQGTSATSKRHSQAPPADRAGGRPGRASVAPPAGRGRHSAAPSMSGPPRRSLTPPARTSAFPPADDAASQEAGVLVLTFSDTGPGIPKEIEHRLFQSFVTSGKKGGTGLGLAIVRKIAEEHGGSITVESTTRGATFTLRLPQPPQSP